MCQLNVSWPRTGNRVLADRDSRPRFAPCRIRLHLRNKGSSTEGKLRDTISTWETKKKKREIKGKKERKKKAKWGWGMEHKTPNRYAIYLLRALYMELLQVLSNTACRPQQCAIRLQLKRVGFSFRHPFPNTSLVTESGARWHCMGTDPICTSSLVLFSHQAVVANWQRLFARTNSVPTRSTVIAFPPSFATSWHLSWRWT